MATQTANPPKPLNGPAPLPAPTANKNPLLTRSPVLKLAEKFNIEPGKLLEVLRGTVIKPDSKGRSATNEELAAFCIVADQYGLSPFTREIHAFVSGDKGVVPIVGIDGWTHIVNQSPAFDGCEFQDEASDNGMPVSITCKMHVKGRAHPICITERYAECKRNSIPWQTMPWRMLRHKAYMQAARYAFGLSGIYDEDEARDIIRVEAANAELSEPLPKLTLAEKIKGTKSATQSEVTTPAAAEESPPEEPTPFDDLPATEEQQDEIQMECQRSGTFGSDLDKHIKAVGGERLNKLNTAQAVALLKRLSALPACREPGDEPDES